MNRNYPVVCVSLTMFALSSEGVCGVARNGSEPPPTARELAAMTLEQRALLQNLEVSVQSVQRNGPATAVRSTSEYFVSDGTRFLYRESLELGDVADSGPSASVVAFDGLHGLMGSSRTRAALQTASAEDLASDFDLGGSDFFASMAWFPSRTLTGQALSPIDLLSVLESDTVTVRPQLELVDGHACAVVELASDEPGPSGVWWLALDRGALPIRQEIRRVDGSAVLVRSISDFAVLANGAWIPARGERVVGADASTTELAGGLSYEFQLLATEDLPAGARVPGLEDWVYDPTAWLNPGTIVWTSDRQVSHVVADADLGRAADRQIAWEMGDVQARATGATSASLPLFVAGGGLAGSVVGVVLGRLRRKQRA